MVLFFLILIVGMKTQEDKEKLVQFGAKVRLLRQERGLTQFELAAKCGLDRNYIGMFERGERNPSYLSMLKIANGLDVNIKEML